MSRYPHYYLRDDPILAISSQDFHTELRRRNANTPELNQFVAEREDFSWKREGQNGFFTLTSGNWRGQPWNHAVKVVGLENLGRTQTAILYITGGDINEPDLEEARAISNRSGLPVAMLFHIPNQPIFEMWEDDLIAHTFQQYIHSGGKEWPLLFPMARAAVRCMDMLGEACGIERFVFTGASKRGWTTWLAAATADPRIIGIAPMVFDNLNFPAQMKHQVASWGGYSEQIKEYTERDLQSQINSERGAHLTRMMDPITYIDSIACPILIVNGSNDRYWTVDALSVYWSELSAVKRCLIVPNVGHILGDKVKMIESVSAFAHSCSQGAILPEVEAGINVRGREVEVTTTAPEAHLVRVWTAVSDNLDFRDSVWEVAAQGHECSFPRPFRNLALLIEACHEGPTGKYSLSAPVQVLRK